VKDVEDGCFHVACWGRLGHFIKLQGLKSGTGPRFFLLALEAVIGYNDNDRERKRLCVVPKLRGLKLLAF
jgi:hypothetical protein